MFCRYLAGAAPDSYICAKYADYHRSAGAFTDLSAFEHATVRLATVHPWLTRVADSYSARFDKCSPLRKKLALLVGILECSPGYFDRIDTAYGGNVVTVLFRLAVAVAASVVALAVSLVLLGPLHLLLGRRAGR